jgi:hypothetical protein
MRSPCLRALSAFLEYAIYFGRALERSGALGLLIRLRQLPSSARLLTHPAHCEVTEADTWATMGEHITGEELCHQRR